MTHKALRDTGIFDKKEKKKDTNDYSTSSITNIFEVMTNESGN